MDAVVVAAQLVTALQAIVSRNVAPTESAVVTIGKIEVRGDSALARGRRMTQKKGAL